MYDDIILKTSLHKRKYNPDEQIHSTRASKYANIIRSTLETFHEL